MSIATATFQCSVCRVPLKSPGRCVKCHPGWDEDDVVHQQAKRDGFQVVVKKSNPERPKTLEYAREKKAIGLVAFAISGLSHREVAWVVHHAKAQAGIANGE